MPQPSENLPAVIADGPLSSTIEGLLRDQVRTLPWSTFDQPGDDKVLGVYTYGHLQLNGAMLDRFPSIKVVSNFGVGVDHINVADAAARGIPVGNTPGVLDRATADMGFCLLMAAGRRLLEGDRYARGPEFTRYDPSYLLGREIHGSTLGIIGMGRIGEQVARRAAGFEMSVMYHNRNRRLKVEEQLGVRYADLGELLQASDYVMLCVPLTEETTSLIDGPAFQKMKSTATLVNISRGQVVDTAALTTALQQKQIYAAALDVTDPEPLPRDHPLLSCDNLVIAPHLGSATEQTRLRMAQISVANLMAGLQGQPLEHEVVP